MAAALAGNLYAGVLEGAAEEEFRELLSAPGLRIERIVSSGQASPPGFWYDQDEDEWVVLLAGAAAVAVAGEPEPRQLRPGSYLHIPAHVRHRVEWTSSTPPTIWLAVHWPPGP